MLVVIYQQIVAMMVKILGKASSLQLDCYKICASSYLSANSSKDGEDFGQSIKPSIRLLSGKYQI